MSAEHVTTRTEGAVFRISLNRPEKKNALTLDMYERLTAALGQAAADEAVRVVLVTGAPGVFTAGNDLGDFMKSPPSDENSPVLRFLRALIGFGKPIIAAVDGPAVGVGTTMLLHCDLVVATDRAGFHMPFTKLGLVPEAASSVLVPALVGRQRASAWLLLARPFGAEEAQTAGLVNQVVAPEQLEPTALAMANELAALPREAVLLTRGLIKHAQAALVDDALMREGKLFIERLSSPETAAALMAFMTKR